MIQPLVNRFSKQRVSRLVAQLALGLLIALLATGCMITSGGRETSDLRPEAGSLSVSFVASEGEQNRALLIGARSTTVNVTVFAQADSGDLRIDVLQPDGSVAFAVEARPDERVSRTGSVQTSEAGELGFRVVARNARRGSFDLFYQLP